jgi:TRAP-type C4-dicarboxylate transport system substrate-binding protein
MDRQTHPNVVGWWNPWEKEIAAKTGGRFVPELYPGQSLGYKAADQLLLASSGTLDMTDVSTGWNGGTWGDLSVWDLPLLFSNPTQVADALKATWDIWQRELPRRFGVYPLMLYVHDEQVAVSKKPLTSVDDFQGQKIRSFNAALSDILIGLGASAPIIPYGEQYAAIQRGVVDGAATGAMSHLAMSHYEVADYLLWGIGLAGFAPHMVVVSEQRWNELPDDIKQTLLDVGAKYTALAPGVIDAAFMDVLAELEGNGMTITKASAEDVARARKIAEEEVWPKWAEERASELGRGLLELIRYSQG